MDDDNVVRLPRGGLDCKQMTIREHIALTLLAAEMQGGRAYIGNQQFVASITGAVKAADLLIKELAK